MKKLTARQKQAYDDIHIGTHIFKKVPSLKDLAKNRNIKIPSFFDRLQAINLKGYLVQFNYCPWCGKKI